MSDILRSMIPFINAYDAKDNNQKDAIKNEIIAEKKIVVGEMIADITTKS